MDSFDAAFWVGKLARAEFFAAELFEEGFRSAFPVARENCGLPIPTPPANWWQYCALYKWPDGRIETAGFCNWIRYDEVYLLGGIVVRRDIYRRMPAAHREACSRLGGFAQIMADTAARELTDCAAWFGYTGDGKSSNIAWRVGFATTSHRHLIVKWFTTLPPTDQERLIAKIAAIGPF